MKALLERGADVDAKEPSRGQTALMWGAAEGHAEVVRLLISAEDKVDARSTAGFTPLCLPPGLAMWKRRKPCWQRAPR